MTAATGFTLNNASTGSITAASRGIEYSESARTTTVKATVTLNGQTSDQASCTISQEPNLRSVDSYSAITISFAYDEATPAAGTIAPAGT